MAQDALPTPSDIPMEQAELEQRIHYDCFRNFSWRTSQKPQSLHLLPLCSLVEMDINDNYQAWVEHLYPLAPGDDYPFPVGQSKTEQDETIKKFRDRILYWSNDGEFKRPEIIAWVQESWDNLQYAAEHSSSLSFQQIIQTFPTDYVEFDKTLSTLESNRKQQKQQAMNDIARRALLYKLFKKPPPNIISKAKELAEIKREVEKAKAQHEPIPTTLPVANSSQSLNPVQFGKALLAGSETLSSSKESIPSVNPLSKSEQGVLQLLQNANSEWVTLDDINIANETMKFFTPRSNISIKPGSMRPIIKSLRDNGYNVETHPDGNAWRL